MIRRRTALAFGLGLLAPPAPLAIRSAAAQAAPAGSAVASFSILADIVREIAGPRMAVTSLAPVGADMHKFQPRPSDVRTVTQAKVFVINGLGLEGWAERLAEASSFRGRAVVATRGLAALPAAHDHAHGHSHGAKTAGTHPHGQSTFDPHAWQDVANMRVYVANIRDGLLAADAAGAAVYNARAEALLRSLDTLDAEIRAMLAPIPRATRRVVTTHEAFTYYGDAYGVDFLAPVGLSGDQEPSPREFAALIAQIRRERIRALFVEQGASSRLLEQISRETGVRIGGTLYADTLSPAGGPAASYAAMMRHNTTLLVEALSG